MSITPDTTPGRSSRRVEAWIYTIMNPVIEAMRQEAHLLERGNLSWRYYSRRAEYIRIIYEYIEPHNTPNLEDFLADNEQFTDKFRQHDKVLRTAEQTATEFFEAVTSSSTFIDEVNDALQRYDSIVDASRSYNASVESIKQDLPKVVAEYLINNVDSLPNTYMTHKFWEVSRQKFQEYKEREPYLKLQNAVKQLREISSELQRDLEDQRLQLCREFDVPAAPPLPPTQFSDIRIR